MTYRVKHLKSGKYVRLTLLSPTIAGREQKQQVIDAFKAARSVQHPNLVRVGELADHEGIGYFVTEDFEGQTLRELLQEYKIAGRQFSLREAAQLAVQLLEGLTALHRAGLTLRSLRPEYVLVRVRYTGPRQTNFVCQVKLLGAGFWDLVSTAALTEDEFSRGEAQYLAPELKSFEPVVTERSDVYSAAVIFYEMLVGAAPVGTFQLPRQRRPDLPPHVDGLVEVALSTAPEDRYPTAADLAADIQRAVHEENLQPIERETSVHPAVWLLATVLVIAVAVILFSPKTDPHQIAIVADSELRLSASTQQPIPSKDEIQAILKPYENMMYVPAGAYITGRLQQELDAPQTEPRARLAELDAYLIDFFEYPNKVNAQPRMRVTHSQAEQLCEEQGKRLCNSEEWEKACRGPNNYIYSYGDTFDADFCGDGTEGLYPSGSKEQCTSGWNIYDMSGNFREWTSSAASRNPERRLVKGGQPQNPERGTRCAFSEDLGRGFRGDALSFRCCMDFDPNNPPAAPAAPSDTPADE
jgi:serine/threonine protein kinase